MCGINLIFAYRNEAPKIDADELVAVRDAMVPRGPDEAGIWQSTDKRIGFGHRRLSIIDLSPTGRQPMALCDVPDSPVITFNGEIYNFHELRKDLERDGATFVSTSDTEVLLHLYRRDGRAMVEQLRGMYAFAIWDPAKRGVLLARDPFGIKPLYYADDGRNLRAASQVKALLHGNGIDTSTNAAGHVGFFTFGFVPDPHTLYKGIRALPAGSTLWCGDTGPEGLRNFFDIAETFRNAEPKTLLDGQELRCRLHEVLLDSVRSHLIADVPVGLFLSAGLDSSTLAALAREASDEPLRSITLGFEEYRGTSADETPLAKQVAGALGLQHQTRWVHGDEFAADRQALFRAMDQPSIDGANTYFVAKAAAGEAGLKVAISGVGGDELFAGYPSFTNVPRLAALTSWARNIPGLGRGLRIITAPFIRHMTAPKYAGLLEYGTSLGDAYLLRRALFMPWELPEILDPDIVREGWRNLAACSALELTATGLPNDRTAVSALELSWYMRGQLLRDADWAGMAHSLEIRTPLVDVDLFRALAPLLIGGRPPQKRDMASAPGIPLPNTVLNRPKSGFSIPIRDWLSDRRITSPERGLRGWARVVYENFQP